jgi:hypothetical protein
MMKLSADQEDKIREWAAEGLSLNEIHKRIGQELGVAMTYMEARLLVADLQVSLKDKNPPPAPKPEPASPGDEDGLDAMDLDAEDDDGGLDSPLGGGKLRVTVDAIANPRTLASGRVTFSDGVGGMWYVDEAGRLGIDIDKPGYRPSETDAMAFQRELQMALQRAGY